MLRKPFSGLERVEPDRRGQIALDLFEQLAVFLRLKQVAIFSGFAHWVNASR
jgi:hypothetical protein